jgi:hypothetical protein
MEHSRWSINEVHEDQANTGPTRCNSRAGFASAATVIRWIERDFKTHPAGTPQDEKISSWPRKEQRCPREGYNLSMCQNRTSEISNLTFPI